jgi:hypothetical protein
MFGSEETGYGEIVLYVAVPVDRLQDFACVLMAVDQVETDDMTFVTFTSVCPAGRREYGTEIPASLHFDIVCESDAALEALVKRLTAPRNTRREFWCPPQGFLSTSSTTASTPLAFLRSSSCSW